MYRVIIRRTERKQVWRRIGRSLRRNETKGEDGLTGGRREEKKGIAMPSLQPPPPLVYDVALDGGGRRKYEENFFFSWPPSNARERERGGGEVGRRGWYVRSAVWKSRQEKWVAGKGEEGRGGEWSSEEIKRKKKGGREAGKDSGGMMFQAYAISSRRLFGARAQRSVRTTVCLFALPLHTTNAWRLCTLLLRRQIIRS